MQNEINSIAELGERNRLAAVRYRKSFRGGDALVRVIEPYSFTRGDEDVMLRCYQIEPEEGWRFFAVNKISEVEDGGGSFKPRATVNLRVGEEGRAVSDQAVWSDDLLGYCELVSGALADDRVTREEREEIETFSKDHSLSIERRRFVHASLFYRCLSAVLDDGVIDDQERAQLKFLDRVLSSLGWSITDG
jgi:hypothetical protein